jgi:hypothetical protein
MITLPILLFLIFLTLAAIHFNWMLGGQWGFDNALPTKPNGERVLNPKPIDSAIVGIGLTGFALFYLFTSSMVNVEIPDWLVKYGGWIIPSIFILRAIGDFNYVGFFKKVKETNFGRMDSKYYCPLCLLVGIIGGIAQIMK